VCAGESSLEDGYTLMQFFGVGQDKSIVNFRLRFRRTVYSFRSSFLRLGKWLHSLSSRLHRQRDIIRVK
jgi:hypothetical protein